MEGFALHNRKTSPYIAQNRLHSKFNGEFSAYLLSLVTEEKNTETVLPLHFKAEEPSLCFSNEFQLLKKAFQ
jgi:hypothetical protein